jgi:hypothetical protein
MNKKDLSERDICSKFIGPAHQARGLGRDDEAMLPVRHTFGYNADETGRVAKSNDAITSRARMTFGFNSDELGRVDKGRSYDRSDRMGHYPLVEWKWNRERCLAYVKQVTGADWQKSACWECPFTALTSELIARQKRFPNQVASAMGLERLSLAMNPRGQLYKKEPLYQIVSNSGNSAAIQAFDRSLKTNGWAVYRVRRVYQQKGKARRCVERVCECESESKALEILDSKAQHENLRVRRMHGLTYAFVRERGATYPTTEEYYVATLALVNTKARYGVEKFDRDWESMTDLYCGKDDLPLFASADRRDGRDDSLIVL